MTENKKFPVLRKPPIVEVVCGVHFEPLELDGMVLGVYWDTRKEDYPTRHLQPAFSEASGVVLGSLPLRAVLVGGDNVHVLQLQHDRFFMNWRAVGETYPRFSTREGRPGLMAKALKEFELFASFCEERFGKRPKAVKVELAKIDLLSKGKHWSDLEDLVTVFGMAGTFGDQGTHGTKEFAVRFVEQEEETNLIVSASTVTEQPGKPFNAVRIEGRAIVPVKGTDVASAFRSANSAVNGVFFKLITDNSRFEPVEEEK